MALAELVQHGRSATSALLAKLEDVDPELRLSVARGLAAIADPLSADALFAALADSDARVRANAAHGLARIKDPRALDALVHTLNDFPDMLRTPFTLSADALIEIGPPALPKVVPLLSAADPETRARAFVVVRMIATGMPEVSDWQALWQKLGSYDPNAGEQEREAAAEQWREWVRGAEKSGVMPDQ